MKAQVLLSDGSYEKVDRRGKEPVTAQEVFCQEAMEARQKRTKEKTAGYSSRRCTRRRFDDGISDDTGKRFTEKEGAPFPDRPCLYGKACLRGGTRPGGLGLGAGGGARASEGGGDRREAGET